MRTGNNYSGARWTHSGRRTTRRRPRKLGPVQMHVLLVLSTRGPSSCVDWAAWYPFDSDQVRGAMDRLAQRGFIDVHGWDGRARTYRITSDGDAYVTSELGEDADLDALVDDAE